MKLSLHINSANESEHMATRIDAAEALESVVRRLRDPDAELEWTFDSTTGVYEGHLRDRNGNSVGKWTIQRWVEEEESEEPGKPPMSVTFRASAGLREVVHVVGLRVGDTFEVSITDGSRDLLDDEDPVLGEVVKDFGHAPSADELRAFFLPLLEENEVTPPIGFFGRLSRGEPGSSYNYTDGGWVRRPAGSVR